MTSQNQTTYLGYAVSPSGRRLVYQAGTANFKSGGTEATLTIHVRRLVYGQCTTHCKPITSAKKTAMMVGVIPYVSTTQYTQTLGYRAIIERKTCGGALATQSRFSYLLIGY